MERYSPLLGVKSQLWDQARYFALFAVIGGVGGVWAGLGQQEAWSVIRPGPTRALFRVIRRYWGGLGGSGGSGGVWGGLGQQEAWSVIRRYWALKVSSGTHSRVISRYSPLLGGSGGVWGGSGAAGGLERYLPLLGVKSQLWDQLARYFALFAVIGGVCGGSGGSGAAGGLERYSPLLGVKGAFWGGGGGTWGGGVWGGLGVWDSGRVWVGGGLGELWHLRPLLPGRGEDKVLVGSRVRGSPRTHPSSNIFTAYCSTLPYKDSKCLFATLYIGLLD